MPSIVEKDLVNYTTERVLDLVLLLKTRFDIDTDAAGDEISLAIVRAMVMLNGRG